MREAPGLGPPEPDCTASGRGESSAAAIQDAPRPASAAGGRGPYCTSPARYPTASATISPTMTAKAIFQAE
jgi:hypothetical protein